MVTRKYSVTHFRPRQGKNRLWTLPQIKYFVLRNHQLDRFILGTSKGGENDRKETVCIRCWRRGRSVPRGRERSLPRVGDETGGRGAVLFPPNKAVESQLPFQQGGPSCRLKGIGVTNSVIVRTSTRPEKFEFTPKAG